MKPGTKFEIGTCYACHQGQVFIAKSVATGNWFVVCEECFTEWPDPESFRKSRNASFEKFGRYVHVTKDEINNHPWVDFVENKADLE